MDAIISKTVESFKSWFVANGGFFHPDAYFQPGMRPLIPSIALPLADLVFSPHLDAFGYKVIAEKEIPADTTIITCPFRLAVTRELVTRAILPILKIDEIPPGWTERQLICTYICLHWVFEA